MSAGGEPPLDRFGRLAGLGWFEDSGFLRDGIGTNIKLVSSRVSVQCTDGRIGEPWTGRMGEPWMSVS